MFANFVYKVRRKIVINDAASAEISDHALILHQNHLSMRTRPIPALIAQRKIHVNFYRKIHPWGFWKPIARLSPELESPAFGPVLINWFLGVCFIFFSMIGIGKLLLGSPFAGAIMILISVCSGILIYIRLRKEWAGKV